MSGAFKSFLSLPDRDKRDVFEVAATRLDTLPSYVEKDFWVCLVLDVLYNKLPANHPRRLFKGGTSLSKVFELIHRFSEDIDLVIDRDGLGFSGERDPTSARHLSNKRRKALFKKLASVCSSYIREGLKTELTRLIKEMAEGCEIFVDEGDKSGQTLLVDYGTHKTAMIHNWLARRPRYHLHFTPTSASWINQIERWFAEITQKQIRRGSYRSTLALEKAIKEFLAVYNEDPKPVIWTKSADAILESLKSDCEVICDTGHSSPTASLLSRAPGRRSPMRKTPDYRGVAKVFRSGRSQAVRLPAACRFDVSEVEVIKEGDQLTLRPRGKNWGAWFESDSRGTLPTRRERPLDTRDELR